MTLTKKITSVTKTIRIGDEVFKTFLDEEGIQRFEADPLLFYFVNNGVINPDYVDQDYMRGKILNKDYILFYIKLGYSFDTLLRKFPELEIVDYP